MSRLVPASPDRPQVRERIVKGAAVPVAPRTKDVRRGEVKACGKFFKKSERLVACRVISRRQRRLFAEQPVVTPEVHQHQTELEMNQHLVSDLGAAAQNERNCFGVTGELVFGDEMVANPPVDIEALADVSRLVYMDNVHSRPLRQAARGMVNERFVFKNEDRPRAQVDLTKDFRDVTLDGHAGLGRHVERQSYTRVSIRPDRNL